MSLSSKELSLLQLILRSTDMGEGWRTVSDALMPWMNDFTRPELIEVQPNKVRLTPDGQVLMK